MDKQPVVETLNEHRRNLQVEVRDAYARGWQYGEERFEAWKRRLSRFLNDSLPGEADRLKSKLTVVAFGVGYNDSSEERSWMNYGERADAFVESLILDISTGDYEPPKSTKTLANGGKVEITKPVSNRVFIVHGHDELTKVNTARFIESLGFDAIILHEQPNRGKTIIEKIEEYTDVGFAIILYTPDDAGSSAASAKKGVLRCRARQNVVLEHGYLVAKLGRDRVVPLVSSEDLELPSDLSGIVYVTKAN